MVKRAGKCGAIETSSYGDDDMKKGKTGAILYALLAAVFYAINMPVSKILLNHVEPTMMAALLYLGAGIGIGIISLFGKKKKGERLTKTDLPLSSA